MNAPHAPLCAPKGDIDKYDGVYDVGLPAIRRRRYERMVEKGIVDPGTWKLSDYEPNKDGSEFDWDGFSAKEKRLFQRKLQIATAMVDRVDQELGKLIAFLKDKKVWDNTLFVFLSDNGATAEHGLYGGVELDKMSVADIDMMGTRAGVDGGVSGSVVATAQNTPLRKFKTTLWDGGMRSSMIVHWPGSIAAKATGSYLRQPIAIFDLAPTCYEAAGVDYPTSIADRLLKPMDGVSFVPLLKGQETPPRYLCYAYKDYRVVRNEKWKLLGQFNTKDPAKAGKGGWQLFDLANDQSEMVDVSGTFHFVTITSDGKTEIRLNAKGTGVGVDTGTEYVWNDTIHQSVDDPDGLELSVTTVQKLRLISKGKAQNLVVDTEATFEVDENGSVTMSNVTVTSCRGAED